MRAHLLQDIVAVVTGGASGIGRAACESLAQEGANVVFGDVDEVSLPLGSTHYYRQLAMLLCKSGGELKGPHKESSRL
jgi:NAD(P)-dependent dehydrogenase (short-subunit alcohol dehydrogenase family)